MVVSAEDLEAVKCDVCGAPLVLSSSKYAVCSKTTEAIDSHGRLVPVGSRGVSKEALRMADLRIATRPKKKKGGSIDAIYDVGGKRFGRVQIGAEHYKGEFFARIETSAGNWMRIRLVPFGTKP